MKKEQTRCFIALDLPRNVINEIKKIQNLIKEKKLFDGKLIEPENLHLTLKCLGEINENKIKEVKEKLKEVEFNKFKVHLGNIGVFPSKYNSYIRVIWIELLGKGVFDLQKQIDNLLSDVFKSEYRFMSHITIARIKRVYDKNGFLEYLDKILVPKLNFEVNRFFLKKSELFESGPVYKDIEIYNSSKHL